MSMIIGNYVHYSAEKYLKYGIDIPDYEIRGNNYGLREAEASFQRQWNLLRKKAKTSMKEAERQYLETQLNYFFNPHDSKYLNTLGIGSEDTTAFYNSVIQLVQQCAGKALNKARVNFNDLGAYVQSSSLTSDFQLQSQLNHYRGLSENKTTWNAIIKRMENLMVYRDSILTNRSKRAQDLVHRIQKLEEEYQMILKRVTEISQMPSEAVERRQYLLQKNYFNSQGFIKELNEIIRETKTISNKRALGYLGEVTPLAIQYVLENNITKVTSSVVSDFQTSIKAIQHKGSEVSVKYVDSSKFISSWKQRQGKEKFNFAEKEVAMSWTQNKVDIDITTLSGNKIPASVKNISDLDDSINILKGTSILKYAQDYPIFTNHYLNITADHLDGGFNSQIEEKAHNLMKMTIGVGALAGGILQKNKDGSIRHGQMAEIFIVNTHGTGKGAYKVYYISDIIDAFLKDPSLLDIKDFNKIKYWDNNWSGDQTPSYSRAWRRIAEILGDLNAFELNAQISKKALK